MKMPFFLGKQLIAFDCIDVDWCPPGNSLLSVAKKHDYFEIIQST